MSPGTFEGEAPAGVEVPSCDVADEPITSGSEARCFAEWMRIHALEGTGGKTFSQMGRFLDARGDDVFSEAEAARDPETGQPVTNPARDLWVTQRALATGLELAFVGEQVSLFSLATGVVVLILGIGLIVMLTVGGVLRGREGPAGGGAAALERSACRLTAAPRRRDRSRRTRSRAMSRVAGYAGSRLSTLRPARRPSRQCSMATATAPWSIRKRANPSAVVSSAKYSRPRSPADSSSVFHHSPLTCVSTGALPRAD